MCVGRVGAVLLALACAAAAADGPWFPFRLPKPPPEIEHFLSDIPRHAKGLLDELTAAAAGEERPSGGLDTDRNFFSGLLSGFKERVRAIYPGTQWCGDGNRARSVEELGLFHVTDGCCREHDSCPEYIGRDERRRGLHNGGLFTRSHCDCDASFYECLKEAGDPVSVQIGFAYFTALGPQCFRRERPIAHCARRAGLTNRCVRYEYDVSSNDTLYQWFDNPEF